MDDYDFKNAQNAPGHQALTNKINKRLSKAIERLCINDCIQVIEDYIEEKIFNNEAVRIPGLGILHYAKPEEKVIIDFTINPDLEEFLAVYLLNKQKIDNIKGIKK